MTGRTNSEETGDAKIMPRLAPTLFVLSAERLLTCRSQEIDKRLIDAHA
jgi:hypothetical protein